MKGYLYILECADGTYYTGSTRNLDKRLWEHENFQGANYTRKKNPAKLVYFEEYSRIDEAFYREKQVQGWSHAKKKALIESNKDKLIELSKNYTQHPRGVASTSSATGILPVVRPIVDIDTKPFTESVKDTESIPTTESATDTTPAPVSALLPVSELVEETDDKTRN